MYAYLTTVKQALYEVIRIHEPLSAAAYEMEINVNGTGLGVLKYRSAPDPRFRERVQKDAVDFARFKAQYDQVAHTPESLELGRRVEAGYREFRVLGEELMANKDRQVTISAIIASGLEETSKLIDQTIQMRTDPNDPWRSDKNAITTEMELDISKVGAWLAYYLLVPKMEYRENLFRDVEEFQKWLTQFRALSLTVEEREWAMSLERAVNRIVPLIHELILLQENSTGTLKRFSTLRSDLDHLLDDKIQALAMHHLHLGKLKADQGSSDLIRVISVVGSAFLLLTFGSAILLIKCVTRPVEALTKGINTFGRGDLELRMNEKGRDEFAGLRRHFNAMAIRLQTVTVSKERLEASEAHLKKLAGDLSEEVRVRTQAEERQARMRAALEDAAAEWRQTFDAMKSIIVVLDSRGYITRLNRAVNGCFIGDVGPGQPWQKGAELINLIREPHAIRSCQVEDASSGRIWDLLVSCSDRSEREDGRIILVARDVTETVNLQSSLRRSETMAVMGSLVASVAHEVRNPLFGISATLDAFEARFGCQAEYQEYAQVLRRELGHLTGLMHDLLEFGKPPHLEFSECPTERVIAEAAKVCEILAKRSDVKIAAHFQNGLPRSVIDSKKIGVVFKNLIENAIYYSLPGGTVTVEVEEVCEGGQAWISSAVKDSGPGFRPEDLPRIFEPFFTRRRQGTGLGLSIVQRIVEEHGGMVSAANRPEGGAVTTVRLPVVRQQRTRPTGEKRTAGEGQ